MPSGSVKSAQRGFTYMGLLLFIAIAGIALSVIGPVWHTEAQREKEKELLFVGDQMAQAISSYFTNTPGGVKQYPATLEDLLQDKRFPAMRRHLRKIYPDPMTGKAEWGLVKQQNRIVGVYSLSRNKPVKQDGFPENLASFAHAGSYQDWQFTFSVVAGVAGTATNTSPDAVPVAATGTATSPVSDSSGIPSLSTGTSSPQATHRPSYAVCSAEQSAENAQCRASCGQLASPACRACFLASFEHYRECLRG